MKDEQPKFISFILFKKVSFSNIFISPGLLIRVGK